jgi:hypothetical protein
VTKLQNKQKKKPSRLHHAWTDIILLFFIIFPSIAPGFLHFFPPSRRNKQDENTHYGK